MEEYEADGVKEEKEPFEPGARGGPSGRKKENGMAMVFGGFVVVVMVSEMRCCCCGGSGEDRVTPLT